MSRFKAEADAADVVIDHLRSLHYDVYCEVDASVGRIDIVAIQGKLITAVEVKNRSNFDVLGQAAHRSAWAHRSVAAFPFPKNMRHSSYVFLAMHEFYGIGIWNIKTNGIDERHPPRINRQAITRYITEALCDEQRDQRAGVNAGFWSPFRQTKEKLIKHVRENQPCTLKSAIQAVEHHYASDSSAYTSVGRWIREGVISEIEMGRNGLVLADSCATSDL